VKGLSWDIFLAGTFVLLILALLLWSLWQPMKLVARAAAGMILGGAAIFIFNLIGSIWSFTLPLNPVSALLVGLLGGPGLLVVIALAWML